MNIEKKETAIKSGIFLSYFQNELIIMLFTYPHLPDVPRCSVLFIMMQ